MTTVDTDERTPNKIYPPWDLDTVEALNHYQQHGQFHPFTCPCNMCHVGETRLVAGPHGWSCSVEDCDYTQGWAWTFMARENHSER